MTDRDRLAADLPDAIWPILRGHDSDPWPKAAYVDIADRLIALGWTRLDEERMARALGPYELPDPWADGLRTIVIAGTAIEVAAAIAKAYREDTDG